MELNISCIDISFTFGIEIAGNRRLPASVSISRSNHRNEADGPVLTLIIHATLRYNSLLGRVLVKFL
jgi:hypothetical protein